MSVEGSTFQISLPLLRGADPIVSLPGTDAKQRRRIMNVDDNEDAANSLAMVLQLEGL